ncbi:MAG: hypothetical protein DHS20C15_07860 [Planctomycetota bacterium]|nr:MAG: hypothetical protein DHS20C15_07860 [Planctomycetota bacterium]
MTAQQRSLLSRVLDPFSSITTGVWLLGLLFLYCSIGSAGVLYPKSFALFDSSSWVHAQLRQWRPFEMTEFEWFHWWPFDLLVGLICVNVVVATLRRIPLNVINLGVWLIHTGILILCLGSWIYFASKVEGDVPVLRRELAIVTPSGQRASLPMIPGNAIDLGQTRVRIWGVDPEWHDPEAAADAPTHFQAQVFVERSDGARFLRTLVDGRPELSADLVQTDDPMQPMKPALEVSGEPLAYDDMQLSLQLAPSRHVYLAHWVQKSWALYLREITGGVPSEWVQRPVNDLPLYNDSVRSGEEIWSAPGDPAPVHPLSVAVAANSAADPLPDTVLRITDYLRYARMQVQRAAGGPHDPYVDIVLEELAGNEWPYTLVAFDEDQWQADEGFVGFFWLQSEQEKTAFGEVAPPRVIVSAPGGSEVADHEVEAVVLNDEELAWNAVPGSDVEFRVEFIQDFKDVEFTGSLASVELRSTEDDRHWRRFVFDGTNVERNVDLQPSQLMPDGRRNIAPTPGQELEGFEDVIDIRYVAARQPAPISILAGPEPHELGVVLNIDPSQRGVYMPVEVGERVSLGAGATLRIDGFASHSRVEARPFRVPIRERESQVRHRSAMIGLEVPGSREGHVWVPYHHYPLNSQRDNLRRFNYDPTEISMRDGRTYQVVLSRQRFALPSPVVLDDFTLTEHQGGYTGSTLSIRDWTSQVRFVNSDGSYSSRMPVSVNSPAEHEGLSYFQMEWDPPSPSRGQGDVPSKGLNYTVLGVGNRHGVLIQLLGCCIAVLGMIYAFYVKPVLRRRLIARARERASTSAGAV